MGLFRRRRKERGKTAGRHRSDRKLVALHSPDSYEAEQFRILKTKLLFPATGQPPRSIMVTSAFRAVGKSFVSANLAVSIAQSLDQYVLLMDCDMRKPTMHHLFGLGDVPGLSEYIREDASLSTLLQKTTVPKLTLLPAGAPPDNPAELLSSQKMDALIEEVTHRYDDRYVIIDAPPSNITAETNAIAGKIDSVILVAKYGETPRESVADLVGVIGEHKIAAIIINQCNSAVDFWGRKKQYYGYNR